MLFAWLCRLLPQQGTKLLRPSEIAGEDRVRALASALAARGCDRLPPRVASGLPWEQAAELELQCSLDEALGAGCRAGAAVLALPGVGLESQSSSCSARSPRRFFVAVHRLCIGFVVVLQPEETSCDCEIGIAWAVAAATLTSAATRSEEQQHSTTSEQHQRKRRQ